MQGMRVQSVVGELRSHMLWGNYAHVPQLLSSCASTREPVYHKLQSPCTLEPMCHNQRRENPHTTTREKFTRCNEEPTCCNKRSRVPRQRSCVPQLRPDTAIKINLKKKRRIRYLGINLSKESKDLHSENCKTLMKEIEDHTNSWKDIPCSWIGRINTVKMTILPKAIYRLNTIPNYQWYFSQIWNTKFFNLQETQKTPKIIIAKIIPRKNRAGGIMLPDFRLYYKATVLKTV